MKKIIIIAIAVITTGLASCSKDNSVKPSEIKAHSAAVIPYDGDLSTGD